MKSVLSIRRPVVLVAVGIVVAVLLGVGLYACGGPDPAQTPASQDYQASTATIRNPERGFTRSTETHINPDGSGYTPLDISQLQQWRAEGTSMVFRYFYMEKYRDQDGLDRFWLDQVGRDFGTARTAGMKLVIRFAYVKGGTEPFSPPYPDAPRDRVLAQIGQLSPVLRDNADVIAVLQAGFIGLWGEWYYTDNFVADPSRPEAVDAQAWSARRDVLLALLDATAPTTMIQVRYPLIKQRVFSGDLVADPRRDRVGVHNDCFLAVDRDQGTYSRANAEEDRDWLARESATTPVGGETCKPNGTHSQLPTALAELKRFHWSFLNRDYQPEVVNSWGQAGQEEVSRRLGYRLSLTHGTISPTAQTGGRVAVDLQGVNTGFAAPFLPRPVQLIFQGGAGTWAVNLPADVRSWQPGRFTLAATVCAPPEAGLYELYLALPDPAPSLSSDPAYAIRLANEDTWDQGTGWNDLRRTVTVGGDKPWFTCSELTRL